jgi:hypothetical protein
VIGTLAAFRAYAAARGDHAPTVAGDAEATAALVRASDHILHDYVARFAPSYDAASPRVEEATYEAAMIEITSPRFFARTYTPGERKVLVAVDTIRWQVVGGGGMTPVSTRIETMLAGYLRPSAATAVLVV